MTGPVPGADFAGLDPDLRLGRVGRPRLSEGEETVMLTTRVPASLAEWVAQQPGSGQSEQIRLSLGRCRDLPDDSCPHCGAWAHRCNLDRGGQTWCAVTGRAIEAAR